MIVDSVRSGPPYESSAVFGVLRGAGQGVSRLLLAFFAWADRCLEGSVLTCAFTRVAGTWRKLMADSVLVRFFWPYMKLAVAPWGKPLRVETLVGLVLALTCVAPTELVMLAAGGVFVLVLWSKARAVRSGRVASLWAFPGFGTVLLICATLTFIVGATITSVSPSLSLFNMVIWLFYFLVFFMAADASHRGRADYVIWPLLTGAAFSGLVSMYQRVTGLYMPASWVDEEFKDNLIRVVGTFTNPIFFAEMMGLALPLTIALIFMKKGWRDRLILLGFAGVQGIGLLLSSTRGAWLGFAASFCLLAVLYDWRMLPLGLAAGAAGFAFAPPILVKRLLSSFSLSDSSNAYRVSIWRGSLAIIREYLYRGIGLGAECFRKIYPEHQIIQTPTPHAHSTYLEFLIEVGLFGFIAMACLFVVWLRDVFDAILAERRNRTTRWAEIGILAGALAAVAGHMLQGVIDYTWYSPRVASVFWAIVGIAAGIAAAKLSGYSVARERDGW